MNNATRILGGETTRARDDRPTHHRSPLPPRHDSHLHSFLVDMLLFRQAPGRILYRSPVPNPVTKDVMLYASVVRVHRAGSPPRAPLEVEPNALRDHHPKRGQLQASHRSVSCAESIVR